MKEPLKLKVLNLINSTGKIGIKLNGITRKFNSTNSKNIEKILKYYLNTGQILQKNNKFFSSQKLNLIRAQITRNFKNYCFAKAIDAQCDYFIPSKFSKNALLNDFVLISKLPKKFIKATSNKSKEGQVVAFIKKENTKFTGTIKLINNIFYVLPDEYFHTLFSIANESQNLKENYKVIATIDRKYFNLSKPFCKIIKIYGDANIADLCALAYLKKNNISLNFKKTILEEAKKLKQSYKKEQFERLDLTKKITFTIDGKNSKDLDDAISIEKFHDFYLVGVHIADVSNFVKFKSKIDVQALKRANSIYFANRVIPMLCEILSNELCSLKSNRIRLTFSVLMKINFEGKIINFKIQKTKIKSKIKGVYEEINQIFENNYTKNKKTALLKKYNKILPQLEILKELCSTLKAKRIKNGTPNLQSNECEIKLDKNNKVTKIIAKKQLIAENIIEELMLMANVCVAKFAKKHKLPIFFRIHEKPTQEKINNFKNLLQNLNINSSQMKPNVKVKTFATLLEKYKNSSKFSIINNNILRTMSKAKYSKKASLHFGLNFKTYTHFTSPIRRYSDLFVHRILTMYIYENESAKKLNKKFKTFLENAIKITNIAEKNTLKIERTCEEYYKAEYMQNKIGLKFQATVSGCTKFGLFVQLKNTIEGFVKIETLNGNFEFDGFCKLICKNNKKQTYTVGQEVIVKCTYANVNLRTINFIIIN